MSEEKRREEKRRRLLECLNVNARNAQHKHTTNTGTTHAYYTLLNLLTHLIGRASPPGHPFDVVNDGPPRRLPRLLECIRHAFVVYVGCGVTSTERRLLGGEEEGTITYFSNKAVGSPQRKCGCWEES